MKKLFAIAALLAAFSPLSHAQSYPDHRNDNVRHGDGWRPGPNMRNDRVIIVPARQVNKARKSVRCRDGSRQYTARACRHHRGVR